MPTTETASRIDWIGRSCRLLAATAQEFSNTRPFAGLTIGTAIHLEPKTAALLKTLKAGGARLIATGNLNSTQADTVAWLRNEGIQVIGEQTTDAGAHGGFHRCHSRRAARSAARQWRRPVRPRGGAALREPAWGTEETTSGRARLQPLRDRLKLPILVINDSPIKQFAENRHAVGQSLFESYMRFSNRSTNGKRVTVFGYGACGKGTAACFRNAFSTVSVVDIDPVATLEAHLDGFVTPLRETAIANADVIVTVTGARGIIGAADLPLLKDGVMVMNGGHFPHEVDVAALKASADIERITRFEGEGIETLHLRDGRAIHILGNGHMANLAGPRPLGNSVESMDLGFALQARCLELVAKGGAGADHCVVPVPREIDAAVASAFLALNR